MSWPLDKVQELEQERDCWIANANELQKAFNKLEKENAELKAKVGRMGSLLLDLRYYRGSWPSQDIDTRIDALTTHPTPESK